MRVAALLFAVITVACATTDSIRCPANTVPHSAEHELGCLRPDGMPDGPYFWFPEKGSLRDIGWHRDGVDTGSWVSFDSHGLLVVERRVLENGRQIARHWYPDGTPKVYAEWQGDVLHGWFRTWYSNGQLESEGRHTEMERDGVWRFWENDGALRESVTYQNGEEVAREEGGR